MRAIPLRTTLVHELIARKYGSVDDLCIDWEHKVSGGLLKTGRPRDRSTVYRWLKNGLPAGQEDVFGFAALLDSDPLALIDIHHPIITERFGHERRNFLIGQSSRSLLRAFWEIYRPGTHWPSAKIADQYYGRDWHAHDFLHDPARIANEYAAVYLDAGGHGHRDSPRVFHFAFRPAKALDDMWRPYGTVIACGRRIDLVTEGGHRQSLDLADDRGIFPVETYFGPGAARFRVASLHPFTLTVAVPSKEAGCARFPG